MGLPAYDLYEATINAAKTVSDWTENVLAQIPGYECLPVFFDSYSAGVVISLRVHCSADVPLSVEYPLRCVPYVWSLGQYFPPKIGFHTKGWVIWEKPGNKLKCSTPHFE